MARAFLSLSDVLALRLECANCGTAVSVKIGEWPGIETCPSCHHNWDPRAMGVSRPARDFMITLRDVLDHEAGMPYRIQIEIEQPR